MVQKDKQIKSQWRQVKNKLLGDSASVGVVNGNHMTLSKYSINKEVSVPMHSHDYEQIIYVLQGKMYLTVEGNQILMKEGDIQVILSNMEHSAEITGVPFQSIEAYHPIRMDLIQVQEG